MAEKRDLIERITELVKNDILNKEDRETSSGYALPRHLPCREQDRRVWKREDPWQPSVEKGEHERSQNFYLQKV